MMSQATLLNPLWSVLMLVLVLALIPAGAWLIRRMPGLRDQRTRSISVLETLNIGPRERLLVVRAGSRTLLIGATSQSISLLSSMPDNPPVQTDAGSFGAALSEARRAEAVG